MTVVQVHEKAVVAKIAAKVLKSRKVAIVFGKSIYLHGVSATDFQKSTSWVAHELKHVEQYKRLGFLKFLLLYIWESILHGYHNNKFEIEARSAEHDTTLLNRHTLITNP